MDLYISDTALKVFRSLYFFTPSICHSVVNYFPRLWGTGISDAIFIFRFDVNHHIYMNSPLLSLQIQLGKYKVDIWDIAHHIKYMRCLCMGLDNGVPTNLQVLRKKKTMATIVIAIFGYTYEFFLKSTC